MIDSKRALALAPSQRAQEAFRRRVAELGGTVLEPAWLGARVKHRVRCPKGHESSVLPYSVARGVGICRTCAGCDPKAAEAAFRARVAELGGVVLEPAWLGSGKPHRVRCAAGHESAPRPGSVSKGQGLCRACVGTDPKASEAKFRALVAEAGGVVLEPKWLGRDKPHHVRCAAGHEGTPIANKVMEGGSICRTCSGRDSKASEAAFRARIAELGATVLEPVWLGALKPHRVRCANGHLSAPWPSSLKKGQGICLRCGNDWDAFYVVVNDEEGHVKFGITSGDGRLRTRAHARKGYTRIVRLLTALPDGVAFSMEQAVISTLLLAGEKPVQGREYFDVRVLATVLDIVDHYGPPSVSPGQALSGQGQGNNPPQLV